MFIGNARFSVQVLKRAKEKDLIRLAVFLRLHNVEGMSKGQLARLIRWRITREDLWV